MENLNLEIITSNILKLLDFSGVADLRFAEILGISEKQFRLIKNEEANFNINNINKACDFFNIQLNKINKATFKPENDLREKLANKHRNNVEYYPLLESRPTIRHAIKFTLLQNPGFISEGLITSDIRSVFLSKGWDFTSRYISTGMQRNLDLVKVVGAKIVKGKKANVYGPK